MSRIKLLQHHPHEILHKIPTFLAFLDAIVNNVRINLPSNCTLHVYDGKSLRCADCSYVLFRDFEQTRKRATIGLWTSIFTVLLPVTIQSKRCAIIDWFIRIHPPPVSNRCHHHPSGHPLPHRDKKKKKKKDAQCRPRSMTTTTRIKFSQNVLTPLSLLKQLESFPLNLITSQASPSNKGKNDWWTVLVSHALNGSGCSLAICQIKTQTSWPTPNKASNLISAYQTTIPSSGMFFVFLLLFF